MNITTVILMLKRNFYKNHCVSIYIASTCYESTRLHNVKTYINSMKTKILISRNHDLGTQMLVKCNKVNECKMFQYLDSPFFSNSK